MRKHLSYSMVGKAGGDAMYRWNGQRLAERMSASGITVSDLHRRLIRRIPATEKMRPTTTLIYSWLKDKQAPRGEYLLMICDEIRCVPRDLYDVKGANA